MALASLSEMDIDALNKYFPSLEAKKKALVVSRVFAFGLGAEEIVLVFFSGKSPPGCAPAVRSATIAYVSQSQPRL